MFNVTDAALTAGSYRYDALGRLAQEGLGLAQSITFSYDRNGNRLSKGAESGASDIYAYRANSNQLMTINGQVIQHNAAGHRTSDRQGARTYEYNLAGRLYKVYEQGNLIATYTYNAFGQRVGKVTGQGTTVYHYDQSGKLISETEATGRGQRDYVWRDNTPVAQIDAAANEDTITYLHTDHLTTPRRGTNSQGHTVWLWSGDAFGSSEASNDPDGDGITTEVNLRFAGQYFDRETELHYNYFRYYDPRTGRYTTSDPIGILGGLNTYAYVYSNPLHWIDPLGLRTAVVINGPTSGNPVGHTAIAFTGSGTYSYGNNAYMMNLTDYLTRESPRRDSVVIIIDTTPEQEQKMKEYLDQFEDKSLEWWPDNCAERTSGALNAGGMRNPYGIFPSTSWPDEVMAQSDFWRQALGGDVVNVPKNSTLPVVLQEFNR